MHIRRAVYFVGLVFLDNKRLNPLSKILMHWIAVVGPLSSSPLFRLTGKSILASPSFSRTAISQSIEARIALAPRMGKFQLRQKCEK